MTVRDLVVVVGQGYVGLPLAVAAAQAEFRVVGLDLDEARVKSLNAGTSPVGDVGDGDLQAVLSDGRYRAISSMGDLPVFDIALLCVPTPYRDDAPDLTYIKAAGRQIGQALRPGGLVILESTTYPGTTEEVLQPILEEASGLRAGVDFDLAFSPERIDPGNPQYGLRNTPKIVGGVTKEASQRSAAFYGRFVERVVQVSGPRTAETAKLLENTFRHINIALVNELAILCQDLDVDVWEVIDAAASKPFGFMPFYPGPGVGGHCIPVDPMYLSWRVRQFGGAAKFIELARDVNAAMPLYCMSRVQDLLNDRGKPLKGSRIHVLGVAYKSNVGDMRESPAITLIDRLAAKGALVAYHDEHVPELLTDEGLRLASADLTDAWLATADCVIVVTAHARVDYARVAEKSALVFDTRRVMPLGHDHVARL